MEEEPLSNKLAVVTGGSRGIGQAIAKHLHEAGMRVVISGRDKASLEESAQTVGKNCFPIVCNHSDPEQIDSFAKLIEKEHGTCDLLINNAGIMKSKQVIDLNLELWQKVIDTNLTGVFLTTKAFLPSMIEKKQGDIILIGSMSGKKGDPGASAYAASKFGLQGFAASLFYEVRKYNIRVMLINPSRVETGPDKEKIGKGIYLHANDIAQTVRHLASLPQRTTIKEMEVWGTNPE